MQSRTPKAASRRWPGSLRAWPDSLAILPPASAEYRRPENNRAPVPAGGLLREWRASAFSLLAPLLRMTRRQHAFGSDGAPDGGCVRRRSEILEQTIVTPAPRNLHCAFLVA